MHFITKLSRRLVQFQYSSFAKFTSNMTQPGTIDFEEICAGLESKSITYMDVRNQSELQSDGQIVGSVNLPLPEIIEAFASPDADFKNKYGFEKPDKSAALVVGCLAGKRAAAAGEQLEKLGFSNFRVYPGSFSDWKAKGGAISKP
ncbi:rhodanese domain-containing protein CG4456-like [Daphnia pulicaria]|uniref:rhodanese domain-containing protein CG4456-like n=1 Tax=Daphnia pulicaria TaxID=35523 RepID=UPI001EE9F1A5|nr:rhodanese domain-containing protein CG4456-like [Daphnia pulicaria]